MQVDVLFLPSEAKAQSFRGKSVAAFDVLRATTTMTAALASGVSEIRLFPSIDDVLKAGRDVDHLRLDVHGDGEELLGI